MGAVPLQESGIESYDITLADLEVGDRPTDPFQAFRSSRFATDRPLLVEAPFDLRLDDGTIVRGRIDAVYGDDSAWEVVDFKSGRPSHDSGAAVQLQAYAVAVRDGAVSSDPPVKLAVTFAYLGDGLTEVTEQADAEWVTEARRRIDLITKGIAEEVFDPVPSEACSYCDFLTFCPTGQAFVAAGGKDDRCLPLPSPGRSPVRPPPSPYTSPTVIRADHRTGPSGPCCGRRSRSPGAWWRPSPGD